MYADDRNFYKVEKWTKDGTKVDRLLYAGNSLAKAQELFAWAIKHRPRICLTIRQRSGCWISGRRLTRAEAGRIAANIAKLPSCSRSVRLGSVCVDVRRLPNLPHVAEQCGPQYILRTASQSR
jgi:hypothetical protein